MPGVSHRHACGAALALGIVLTSACSPEIGSEAWCHQMDQTPKSDWSLNQAGQYAKSCVIPLPGKIGSEKWCSELQRKPPADWSANDAKNFASQCLLR